MNPRRPFDPARFPFYYGYWIVVVSTLGILASIPGQTMGVSVFNDALIEATGLSRLSVSNAYLTGTLLSGLLLPLGGSLLDRLGARPTAMAACLGVGISLLALSHTPRMATWGWAARFFGLAALFFSLRFSGQGMLTMVSRTMLGRWFEQLRGRMAGISGVFVGFGFGIAPQALHAWIVLADGWQNAWRQIAVVIVLGMGSCAYFFFRSDPESCGLQMDGHRTQTSTEQTATTGGPSATRAEALRSLRFWAVSLALAFQALIITGITFHIVDLGSKVGLDRAQAVAYFLPMSVLSTFIGLVGGIMADRLPIRPLLLAMMGGQALGLWAATDLAQLSWLFAIGLGISGGLFNPIATVAFPRFFGRTHLGAIAGVEMMLMVMGSALGPSWLALVEGATASYAAGLLSMLALPCIGALLALLLRE